MDQFFVDEDEIGELLDVFILEFDELLDIYSEALRTLQRIEGDHMNAVFEIFRVYHTWKGDAAFFGIFHSFVEFASSYTEKLRDPDPSILIDYDLIRELRENYQRISTIFNAVTNGKSLQQLRFKLFLSNF